MYPEWLNRMFFKNTWLWFHMLAACALSRIALLWFEPATIFYMVVLTAIAWELFYDWLFVLKWIRIKDRATRRGYFFDSLGDILGATLCSIPVIF